MDRRVRPDLEGISSPCIRLRQTTSRASSACLPRVRADTRSSIPASDHPDCRALPPHPTCTIQNKQAVESLMAATYHLTSACSRQPGDRPLRSEGAIANENPNKNANPQLSQPAASGEPAGSVGKQESLPLPAAPEGVGSGNGPADGANHLEGNEGQQAGHGSDDMELREMAVPPGGAQGGSARHRGSSASIDREGAVGCRRALDAGDGASEESKRIRMSSDGAVGGGTSIQGAGGSGRRTSVGRRAPADAGMEVEGGNGKPVLVKTVDPLGSLARSRCGCRLSRVSRELSLRFSPRELAERSIFSSIYLSSLRSRASVPLSHSSIYLAPPSLSSLCSLSQALSLASNHARAQAHAHAQHTHARKHTHTNTLFLYLIRAHCQLHRPIFFPSVFPLAGAQEGWHVQAVNGVTVLPDHTCADIERLLRGRGLELRV
jgi:hypothetical protein